MAYSRVGTLSSQKLKRPVVESVPESTPDSCQFNGKQYQASKVKDLHGIKPFVEEHQSHASRLISGLAHWIKATVSYLTGHISEQEATQITDELLKSCPKVGDSLVLNFNGGGHIGILVRTDKGFAYLSHEKSSRKHKDIVPGEQKHYSNNDTDEVAGLMLRKNILKHKDKKLLSKNTVKLEGMRTGKMIKDFNKSRTDKAYSIGRNNCSHVAMKIMTAGALSKEELVEISALPEKQRMEFPQNAMALARNIKTHQDKQISKRPSTSLVTSTWKAQTKQANPTNSSGDAILRGYYQQRRLQR